MSGAMSAAVFLLTCENVEQCLFLSLFDQSGSVNNSSYFLLLAV